MATQAIQGQPELRENLCVGVGERPEAVENLLLPIDSGEELSTCRHPGLYGQWEAFSHYGDLVVKVLWNGTLVWVHVCLLRWTFIPLLWDTFYSISYFFLGLYLCKMS